MHNVFNYFFGDLFEKHIPSKDMQVSLETEKQGRRLCGGHYS